MKQLLKTYITLMLLLSTMVFAHNWRIYDNTPAGASIQSVEDEGKNNAVLFDGAGTNNGYILGGREWESQKWNDTVHKSIQWSMKFDASYVVYVRVMTTKGARYIYYTRSNTNREKNGQYIHLGLGSESADGRWHTITRDLNADLHTAEPDNTVTAINAILVRGDGIVGDVKRVGSQDHGKITIHGAKPDNSGDGAYYKWDDADAVRGLVFDATQEFTLKSVKVYNQPGEEATRTFTLYNSKGEVVDAKSAYIKSGEQRVALNFQIPKGSGYKLMADIHKGLYKNNNVSYPIKVGDVATITGSDIDRKHYYFFYDWEVEYSKGDQPPSPVHKVFIPKYDFNKQDIYGNGQIVHVNNTAELKQAIEEAKPYTTIILDGSQYNNVRITFPEGIHHLTIMGLNRSATIIPVDHNDNSAFRLPNATSTNKQVHDINMVNFTVSGKGKQFVKSVYGRYVENPDQGPQGTGRPYGPYNIYFYKMTFKDLFMGLYSGLQAHDWTVDHCYVEHSTYSHFWYMMGWHLAVINSTLIDPTHTGLAIRGYYPEGEVHTYISDDMPKTDKCYGNKYVLDRGNRSVSNGFLERDDWTHKVVNNTFKGSANDRGDASVPYVAFAYGIYDNDQVCDAEKTYLPPQNILVQGNTFDTHGGEIRADAIQFDAWQGVNNDSVASINNITIKDNTFIKSRGDEQFIVIGDNGNKATQEEIDRSTIEHNIIK